MNDKQINSTTFILAAALLFLIPWQFYFKLYGSLDTSFVSVLELFLLVAICYGFISSSRSLYWHRSLGLAVTFFWGTMLISIVFAADMTAAVKYGVKWSSFLFLYYLFSNLDFSLEQIKKLLLFVGASGLLLAVAGVIQFFIGQSSLEFIANNPVMSLFIEPDTWRRSGNFMTQQIMGQMVRPAVVFADVISYTAFLGLIFPICLGFSLGAATKEWRYFAITASALITLAVYFTQTRSAYLALVTVLVVMGSWIPRTRRGVTIAVAFLALFTILVLGFPHLFGKTFEIRTINRFKQGVTLGDSSATHRIKCWLRALEVTTHYPYLGIGLANQSRRQAEFINTATPPHSNYYNISAEQGLLGLVAFAWLIIAVLRAAYHLAKNPDLAVYGLGFLGLISWLLVQSLFGHYFFNDKFAMLFWAMLGLLANLERFDVLPTSEPKRS